MSYIYNALKKAEQEGKLSPPHTTYSIEGTPEKSGMITLPREVIKEFTILRQKVQQTHAGQGTQTIVITSSISGEGRTTIAYFLSLMLSQSMNGFHASEGNNKRHDLEIPKGKKNSVLLIDGNLERPLLHRLFDTSQSPGLIEFVFNANTNSVSMQPIVNSYLYLITAGKSDINRHDIWSTDRLKNLFNRLKENFEYILIDAPPVMEHPETLSLCKLADGVLLVVKANQTRWEIIEEAKQLLMSLGANILGVVLNERKHFIPQVIYKRV